MSVPEDRGNFFVQSAAAAAGALTVSVAMAQEQTPENTGVGQSVSGDARP